MCERCPTCSVSVKVPRGRVQGSLDVSLAVMSINKKTNRIDLDAGDVLYHMKVNSAPPSLNRWSFILKRQSQSSSCLIKGKEPRALLHLGDQATSAPRLQEERGGSGSQRVPPDPLPRHRGRRSPEKWRFCEWKRHT